MTAEDADHRTADQIYDAVAGRVPMSPAKKPVVEAPTGPTTHKHWNDERAPTS